MIYNGIPGSPGIAVGKPYLHLAKEMKIDRSPVLKCDIENELKRLDRAVSAAMDELADIRDRTLLEMGEENARVFDAQMAMLNDPALIGEAKELIKNECANSADAVDRIIDKFTRIYLKMNDEYLRERAADIKDVGSRLIKNILGTSARHKVGIDSEAIIVADDLMPSDIALFDKRYVLGFATYAGGATSHAAIMARSLGIPAVSGLEGITSKILYDGIIILDGNEGKLITQPDNSQLKYYRMQADRYFRKKTELKTLAMFPAVTTDGRSVSITGNIGSPRDLDEVVSNGGDGVGLYRTEFLYLEKETLPDEEEQFQAYKTVAERLGGKPVTIRTLDIGGDKKLPYLELPVEANPFLGWRAIRVCLERREIFKTQLRAILRASAYGDVHVMYPMISSANEVREANVVLEEAKKELRTEGVAFNENIKVGVMIEIPSAALTADIIIKEADFFSIGTNDLCQYTLAVDRMNPRISHLYQPLHPAVLRLVKNTIEVSHNSKKFTGMCGEMAGEPLASVLLLGLGLDEFSMSASSMLLIKRIIRNVSFNVAKKIAAQALKLSTAEDVRAYMQKAMEKLGIEY